MSIDIDEAPQPWMATLGHTLLRNVLGFILVGHAVERFLHLRAFQGELIALALPDPEITAIGILGAEFLAGLGLVFGRWTRLSAFVAFCEAFAVITLIVQHNRMLESVAALESAVLLGSVAFYFMAAGSGVFSADTLLRTRARLKALRDDEIWQRPPYITSERSGVYEGDDFDTPRASVVVDDRRRGLRFHSSRG